MWEWSRGVMVRGRVVEIGGLIDREFQTLRSTVELGSRRVTRSPSEPTSQFSGFFCTRPRHALFFLLWAVREAFSKAGCT